MKYYRTLNWETRPWTQQDKADVCTEKTFITVGCVGGRVFVCGRKADQKVHGTKKPPIVHVGIIKDAPSSSFCLDNGKSDDVDGLLVRQNMVQEPCEEKNGLVTHKRNECAITAGCFLFFSKPLSRTSTRKLKQKKKPILIHMEIVQQEKVLENHRTPWWGNLLSIRGV